MGNPEPNPVFRKQTKVQKRDRCRDSMEAVLTNGVDWIEERIEYSLNLLNHSLHSIV